MNSEFKVNLTKIKEITPHPNADKLEFVWCYGFAVIVRKDEFVVGDSVFYIPIDSVLNPKLEAHVFPPGSKITLNKGRVKQTKIRGAYSSGMILDPDDVFDFFKSQLSNEKDYAEELGITKYEPPTPSYQGASQPRLRDKPLTNPHFREYNGIANLKYHPDLFEKEEVIIQEKVHGSHCRLGFAPFTPNTVWKKILKFIRFAPTHEYVWGSNRVELTNRSGYKGFYGEDIYSKALKACDAFSKIKPNEFVHGEVVGPGVQQGYSYGLTERKFIIFDVRVLQPEGTQKWLNPDEVEVYAKERGFDFVPVLFKGLFSKEIVEACTRGASVLCPAEKIREGCVVKSRHNYDQEQNKRSLKSINPDYLNGDQSDNH